MFNPSMTEFFYFSHYFSDLLQILNQSINDNLPKDFASISQELKKELNLPLHQPIIMTGHQPILYYPGIFVKLILTSLIARYVNGKAYYLVLDTDKEKIYWKFIYFFKDYHREDFLLNDPKNIILHQWLQKKDQLLDWIERWELELYYIFEPSFVPVVKMFLESIKEFLHKSKKIKITDLSVFLNTYYTKEVNIKIEPIFLSHIVNTKTYRWLFEFIKSNYKKFYKITNTFLNQFRRDQHIKNLAIPFPNLKQNELPFWLSDGYNRRTLTIYDDDKNQMVLPKALIISLIIRGFLSNLMIHGIGGGFYDVVVEKILNEFLGFQVSPFVTTTATIFFPYKASINLIFPEEQEILDQIRKWKFNPEIYLNEECKLRRKKIFLYNLKNFYDVIKKNHQKKYERSILEDTDMRQNNQTLIEFINNNQNIYAKILHKEIQRTNHKIHLYTLAIKKILKEKLNLSQQTAKLKKIFLDRSLPIFYYDVHKLYEKYTDFFYKK